MTDFTCIHPSSSHLSINSFCSSYTCVRLAAHWNTITHDRVASGTLVDKPHPRIQCEQKEPLACLDETSASQVLANRVKIDSLLSRSTSFGNGEANYHSCQQRTLFPSTSRDYVTQTRLSLCTPTCPTCGRRAVTMAAIIQCKIACITRLV